MSDSALLVAINERTAATAERVDEILEHVRTLNKAVFLGNGKESLMTRVSLLEDDVDQQTKQCVECKATILVSRSADKESDSGERLAKAVINQQTELKKTDMVEGRKFKAVVGGWIVTIILAVIALIQVLQTAPKP